MKLLTATVLLVALSAAATSQVVPGQVFLHSDRGHYITGERIAWAFYELSEAGSRNDESSVGYVELLNVDGNAVAQTRFPSVHGYASGSLAIPDTLTSGYYTLRAYTRVLRNNGPSAFCRRVLFIYNPFAKAPGRELSVPVHTSRENISGHISDNLHLSGDVPASVAPGEIVNLTLNLDPGTFESAGKTFYSASVAIEPESPWLPATGYITREPDVNITDVPGTGLPAWMKENNGPYLDGNVIHRSTLKPVAGLRILLSIPGRETFLQYSVTDESGNFRFIVPLTGARRDYIIQPSDFAPDYIIKIISPYDERRVNGTVTRVAFDENGLAGMMRYGVNYQAGKIFGTDPGVRVDTIVPDPLKSFYSNPDLRISLEDYIDLPTVEEIFHELVPGVVLRRVDNKPAFIFVNELTGEKRSAPGAVFLDGVILDDPSVLASIDPDLLDRIEVVKRDYQVGSIVLKGFISIYSIKGDMCGLEYPVNGIRLSQRILNEPAVVLNNGQAPLEESLPDLRNRLWWSAGEKPGEDGEIGLSFRASESTGRYRITIQGITDTGERFLFTRLFEVKR